MNIIEMEDMVKGLPDQVLFQEAQAPSGRFPQYLAVSEIQRRNDMRQRFSARAPQEGTVKDQILNQGLGSLQGMMPESAPPMAPGMAPPMTPQMAPEMGQTPPNMGPPVQMYGGGIVRMQEGGITPEDEQYRNQFIFDKLIRPLVIPSYSYGRESILEAASRPVERSILDFLYSIPSRGGSALPSRGKGSVQSTSPVASSEGSRAPTILPGTYNPSSALLGDPISFDKAAPEVQQIEEVSQAPSLLQNYIPTSEYSPDFSYRKEILDAIRSTPEGMEEAFKAPDYSNLVSRLNESAKRYSQESEESIRNIREQAKQDAFSYALMQMGAGLAAGDMAGGLERGSKAAFDVIGKAREQELSEKRAARAEARAIEAQGMQLEISGIGLSAEANRERFKYAQDAQRNLASTLMQLGADENNARYHAASLATQIAISNAATGRELSTQTSLDRRAAANFIQDMVKSSIKELDPIIAMNPEKLAEARRAIYIDAAKMAASQFPNFDFEKFIETISSDQKSSGISGSSVQQLESILEKMGHKLP